MARRSPIAHSPIFAAPSKSAPKATRCSSSTHLAMAGYWPLRIRWRRERVFFSDGLMRRGARQRRSSPSATSAISRLAVFGKSPGACCPGSHTACGAEQHSVDRVRHAVRAVGRQERGHRGQCPRSNRSAVSLGQARRTGPLSRLHRRPSGHADRWPRQPQPILSRRRRQSHRARRRRRAGRRHGRARSRARKPR